MPVLPDHIGIGRATVTGPAIGGYMTWHGGPYTSAAEVAGVIIWGFVAPCDIRITEISWVCPTAATANVDIMFAHNATFSATSDTDLLAAAIAIDVNETGYARAESGGTTTIPEAARDIAKGRCVFMHYTSDDVPGAVANLNWDVTGYATGHINANPEYD